MGMAIDRWDIDGKEAEALIIKNRLQIRNRGTIHNIELSTIGAIPKADYENRLKADMVAMLTEIQLEIEEKFNDRPFSYNHHQRTEFYRDIDEIIQQKIDRLAESEEKE